MSRDNAALAATSRRQAKVLKSIGSLRTLFGAGHLSRAFPPTLSEHRVRQVLAKCHVRAPARLSPLHHRRGCRALHAQHSELTSRNEQHRLATSTCRSGCCQRATPRFSPGAGTRLTAAHRRKIMKVSRTRGLLLACLLVSPLVVANRNIPGRNEGQEDDIPMRHNEATVVQLQAEMASGELTSEELTREYIRRIIALDQNGPGVNSVIELNPDALTLARQADEMRRHGHVLGPLHGIPVLVKDNVDTGDKMQTSAGSFALVGMSALHDSTVAANLRAGGAVILGKTHLSEWANFRSFESVSGWSGRGGQTNNPYGITRNACGSSSGSGAATSANFATISFGTETDGSIVCPANANGVVGIKPTVGLTSRAGIVPISHTQDTFGPHGRYVADAAVALGVVQSVSYDGRDLATAGVPLGWQGRFTRPTNIPNDYTQFLDPNGLRGARLGVTRAGLEGFDPNFPTPPLVLAQFEAAISAITAAGATVIDLDQEGFVFPPANGEFE